MNTVVETGIVSKVARSTLSPRDLYLVNFSGTRSGHPRVIICRVSTGLKLVSYQAACRATVWVAAESNITA